MHKSSKQIRNNREGRVRFTFKKHPTQKLLKKLQILGGFEELGEERTAAASSVLACAAASVAWGE
jgi:hypothetical protein